METWLTVIWCLLIVFTLLMGIKETFQFLQAPFSYIKSSENWGQWALIVAVFSAAWPANIPDLNLHSWQYPAAAVSLYYYIFSFKLRLLRSVFSKQIDLQFV